MREQIEKKIGCSIEEFLKKVMEEPNPISEAEYNGSFSIFSNEENDFIYDIIQKMSKTQSLDCRKEDRI